MKNTKLATALIGGASLLTAVLCVGCSSRDEDAQSKIQDQQEEQHKQAEQEEEDNNNRGLRVDPLGKFTTPGRCVGWTCF